MDIIDKIRNFLSAETSAGSSALQTDPGEDLLSAGIIDSMTLLKLVSFMEETFGIKVLDEDINKRNFRNLTSMKAFIEFKQETAEV